MKPIVLKNIVNGELFICQNIKKDKKIIDGIEYLLVRKYNTSRAFFMRKDALHKVDLNAKS